jgi:hypothetical protein
LQSRAHVTLLEPCLLGALHLEPDAHVIFGLCLEAARLPVTQLGVSAVVA